VDGYINKTNKNKQIGQHNMHINLLKNRKTTTRNWCCE